MTKEFNELSDKIKQIAIERIKYFSDFNENNDPYSEHDIATVKLESIKNHLNSIWLIMIKIIMI